MSELTEAREAYDKALEDAYAQLNEDQEHMAALHGAAYESADSGATKRFNEAVQPARERFEAAVAAENAERAVIEPADEPEAPRD